MNEKKIALVTGANKGIGYEIAAGLGTLGYSVGVGARDEARREIAVEKLRAAGHDVFGGAAAHVQDRARHERREQAQYRTLDRLAGQLVSGALRVGDRDGVVRRPRGRQEVSGQE